MKYRIVKKDSTELYKVQYFGKLIFVQFFAEWKTMFGVEKWRDVDDLRMFGSESQAAEAMKELELRDKEINVGWSTI